MKTLKHIVLTTASIAGFFACIAFVLACAAGPTLLLLACNDWTLGPDESDIAVVLVLLGNVTGASGIYVVWTIGRYFTGQSNA